MRRKAWLVASALTVSLIAAGAGPAHAGSKPGNYTFTCRSSAVRATGKGSLAWVGTVEPVTANGQGATCANGSGGAPLIVLPAGLGRAEVVNASSQMGSVASSQVAVAKAVLTVPGLPMITANVLTANAEARCRAVSGTARVVSVTIGTTVIQVPEGHTDISVGPLATLHLNETIRTGDSITTRALWLETPLADIVVSEASASHHHA